MDTMLKLQNQQLATLQAQRNYDNSRFIAPVSGYIVNLPVKVGETLPAFPTIPVLVFPARFILTCMQNR